MTDPVMFVIFGIIIFCGIIIWMISQSDYEHQEHLAPGTYKVGFEKDIRPGRCDLVAEAGGGSFMVRHKNADSWFVGNAIGVTSGLMPGSFRNLTMKRGDVLEINGNVKVLLTPPVPIRSIKKETLGPGIYRFGVDLPPARYDFKVESGEGEIILVDIFKNSFNLFQDMAKGHPQRAKSYDNVFCSRRYEIWVNGSLQVKLKKSKVQPLFMGFREG